MYRKFVDARCGGLLDFIYL